MGKSPEHEAGSGEELSPLQLSEALHQAGIASHHLNHQEELEEEGKEEHLFF